MNYYDSGCTIRSTIEDLQEEFKRFTRLLHNHYGIPEDESLLPSLMVDRLDDWASWSDADEHN